MSLANKGWLISNSCKKREEEIPSTTWLDATEFAELDGCRVTKIFLIGKVRPSDVSQDLWVVENRTADNAQWSGTLF